MGTMSGTSCDGLDVVLIEVDPSGIEVMGLAFKAFPYPKAWQERLRTLGSLTDADALEMEAEWTAWVMAKLHPLLEEWSNTHGPLHLLGFSGHTWYHEPGAVAPEPSVMRSACMRTPGHVRGCRLPLGRCGGRGARGAIGAPV